MSTNKTKNLNLHSWVETDPVLMSEFNENFDALDAESKKLANDISALSSTMSNDISSLSTALTNDISSLNTTMTNSINSVNTTLTSKINSVNSALSSKIDTHAAEAAETYGTCQVVCGTYIGDGTYTKTLHFPKTPKFVIIRQTSNSSLYRVLTLIASSNTAPAYKASNSGVQHINIEWSENSVNWYSSANSDSQFYIHNTADTEFHYFAICA